MKKTIEAQAGVSLIIGSLLIMFTMGLHPSGGSFEQLINITSVIVISHSIALLAIPFCGVGFWGLTQRLSALTFLSLLGFAFSSMGLLAGMCAATVNGLMLPLFIGNYQKATSQLIDSIRPNLILLASLNHAFDLVLIGAVCLAVLSWSVVIVSTKALPVWLGWLGVGLPLLPVGLLLYGFDLVHLSGFRVFTLGLAFWIICVGYWLQKSVFVGGNGKGPI